MPTDLCRWDCSWYVHTAKSGYDITPQALPGLHHGQANWVFLPLYPALIHILSWTGLSDVVAGFLISNLCFLGFMLAGYRYLAWAHTPPSPFLFFGFLAAFPYGLYFSLTYTESLYALLATLSFTAMTQQRSVRACLYAGLLSITRVTGILVAPAFAIRLLWPLLTQWLHRPQIGTLHRLITAALPLCLIPLGLGLYMIYLHSHVGDVLAMVHGEAAWDRTPSNPFAHLVSGLLAGDISRVIPMAYYSWQFFSLCGVGGLLLSVWIWQRGRQEEAWFLAATILVAASTGLISMPRFVLANPIFLLFFYILLSTGWRRRLLPGLIILFALLQIRLLHSWLHGYVFLV